MRKIINIQTLLFLVILSYSENLFSENIVNDDLRESLESLYNSNPELIYEREVLKSRDELVPQAYAEFRPEIEHIV